jgi:chaperonin GroES
MAKLTLEKIQDATNVAKLLDDARLVEIGSTCVENYEKDKQSRKEWEDRAEDSMKLALQVAEEKTFPWQKASNVKYPLLTLAAVQFAARVDLFTGKSDYVKCKVTGWDQTGSKRDRAIRIQKHMTWQLTQEMRDWEEDNDRLFHALPITGSMFKKSYFDNVRGTNVSELVYPRDLVFDYWAKGVEDCIRKTHVMYMTPNKIREKVNSKIFRDVDLTIGNESPERLESELIEGTSSYEDENAPRTILEQHNYLDLDGDGYQEPYIVTVDKDTKEVLRIVARWDDEGIITDDEQNLIAITPTEYFTQFSFIPDPNGGNLGLGLGHLLGPINESVNTLINQLVDAGTISNMQSGFIGKGLRIKSGKLQFQPGEWKFVQSTGDDLQKNIVPLPIREPSAVLFKLLGMLVNAGERVGSVTDAMVGENPPINQPATTTLATIEQGSRVFKRVHKRLFNAFTREFKKLFRLNQKYVQPEVYFDVLDVPQEQLQKLMQPNQQFATQQQQMLVTLDDYKTAGNDVYPSGDPNITTEMEKMQKIEVLLQTKPMFNWNPEVLKKRFVEALDFANPEELMTPAPPQPPPPEVMKIQQDGQIRQAELQLESQKIQSEQQLKQMEMQLKQEEMQLQNRQLELDVQKSEMEVVKIEAEIRKILAEIEAMGGDEEELALEAQKLALERDKVMTEAELKRQELLLKNKEIESNTETQRYVSDTKNQKDVIVNMQSLVHDMHKSMQEQSGPKRISRDSNGLITGIGNMKVVRDESGKAIGVEPTEMPEEDAQEELDDNDNGQISGSAKKAKIRAKKAKTGNGKAA